MSFGKEASGRSPSGNRCRRRRSVSRSRRGYANECVSLGCIVGEHHVSKPTYSFVIPVYNEEETLPELYRQLCALMDRLDGDAEVVLVDDGSRDQSYPIMTDIHRRDSRFKVVSLSRNFGHQIAITAGMDLSNGQAIIIMDADLQDPPDVVLDMTARWREGFEIVYAIREHRTNERWFKRITASIFYRLLQRLTEVDIPADVGDFRLVDRKALNAFKAMRENSRYIRGMFSWIGFQQTGVRYVRAGRFAGATKYPLKKMLRLAIDAIVSFSNIPLRLTLNLGVMVSGVSFLAGFTAIILKISGVHTVSGWTSLVVVVSFLGGVQLIVLGMMGEYLGRIYEEVKNRPLYIARTLHGFGRDTGYEMRAVISSVTEEEDRDKQNPEITE
ncbi:MAG: glycosyltransferase family 2 protein [Candidatus Latescibacteria bacterium]|nr:glycosyltransferase family 2 protein [Candidatus Latescibacterota bacterium]